MKKKSTWVILIAVIILLGIGAALWFVVVPRLRGASVPAPSPSPTAAPSATAAADAAPAPTGDGLAGLPESVRKVIPEGYNTISEIVTLTLKNNDTDQEEIHPSFHFQTAYQEGETVFLLFKVNVSGKAKWFVRRGTGQADGSVTVTLEKKHLEVLDGKKFSLVVVCK